ncbi:MAG: Plug domain-containing protein [Parafilimonas sp.]
MSTLKKIFFLFFFPVLAKSQDINITNINDVSYTLIKNLRAGNAERILLETNKKIYASKQTIWFKAFEVDSLTGKLTNKSRILYVDLVDEKDAVIKHSIFDFSMAQQEGSFVIDSSLNGYYWLRAYTKNILNTNINNIAVKPVYIITSKQKTEKDFKKDAIVKNNKNDKLHLEMYAEGGVIMSGAAQLVAVKVTGEEENPIEDSGFIKNNLGEIITRFSTNNYGLGKFSFEPSVYKTYSIFFLNNSNYDSIATLPRINPNSAQLAVTEQTPQSIKLRVLLEDSIYKKDYPTFLIALHNDSICLAANGQGMYEFDVPLLNFPGGVANLLLFNAQGKLLSERNIYVNKNNININVKTDKENYGARENVNMNIAVNDGKGKPVLATLSVSVNDSRVADSLNDFSKDALANLSPGDADLYMLTSTGHNLNYWRNLYSFNIDSSVGSKPDILSISGLVLNKKHELVANKNIMLISNSASTLIFQDTTNASGKFSLQTNGFNKGTAFGVQVGGDQNTKDNYDIIIDSVLNIKFKTPAALKQKFSVNDMQDVKKKESFYLDTLANEKGWLPKVTVSTSANKSRSNTSSGDVITKEMLHSGRINNVGDAVLQSGRFHIIAGYLMSGGPSGFTPSPSDEPVVMMDGTQMSRSASDGPVLEYLKTIPVANIDHINILTGTAASIYGMRSGSGVIEIFTLSTAYNPVLPNGYKIIYPEGFDVASGFEMPDYSNKQIKNSKEADTRTDIYWNANIITGADGNANINFFTADATAIYVVTIAGITANGDKIFKTFTIKRGVE